MTEKEFRNLDVGDIVRHQNSKDMMVVYANYGNRVTAVRCADLTNAKEWHLLAKAVLARPEASDE